MHAGTPQDGHWIKGEHGYFMGSVSDGQSGGGAGGGVPGGIDDENEKGAILKGTYNPADISKAISQEGTNFVTKDLNNPESLYGEMIEKVPPEKDWYDIKAHGSSDSVKIFDSVVDSAELARIITLRSDYHGQKIRLLCCDTGKEVNGTCVAKELSRLLGVKVKAPTEMIFASNDGSFKIMSEDYSRIGKMEVFGND